MLTVELLWYDDDKKRSLADKVLRASNYYANKYGVSPTDCYVNPVMLEGEETVEVWGVRVIPNKTVIKNHFWLGIGEGAKPGPKAR